MSVLNNAGYTGGNYNKTICTPLTTAIDKKYPEMAAKLLELGAKSTIDFESWVKTYIASNKWAANSDSDSNKARYQDSLVQPIVLAAGKEMGQTIEDLLAHGADPSTLEKTAFAVIKNPQSASYQTAESLLDIVQKKLKLLREYEDPGQEEDEPETLRDEAFYISGLKQGTYQYWSALKDIQSKKESNRVEWELYKKKLEGKSDEGVKKKREAIDKLTRELEKAEQALLKAGAKTFTELHPDIPPYEHSRYRSKYIRPKPGPYETKIGFALPDLTDTKKEAYISLFEAAWDGDLEKIKSLTLSPWPSPPLPLQPPLKVAVRDLNGFSPFSIAVLQGHHDLARKIVDICATQVSNRDRNPLIFALHSYF
jgi:hypothetical protein